MVGYGLENDTANQQRTLIKYFSDRMWENVRLVFVWVNVIVIDVKILICYTLQGIYLIS